MAQAENRIYQCSLCPKSYKLRRSLRRHVKGCHEEPGKTFQCSICQKVLGSKDAIRHHKQWIHGNKLESSTHICPVCHKRFQGPSYLKGHQRVHTGERPHVCLWCDTTVAFSGYGNLLRHIRAIHTKERPFRCLSCPKAFSSSSDLKGHQITHESERLLINCPNVSCKQRYKTRQGLEAHFKVSPACNFNLKRPVKELGCPMCPKYFLTRRRLSMHILSHLGEKAFACSFCPKSFASNDRLERHVRVHLEERPHPCSLCAKAFKTMYYLRQHQKGVHGPGKKFFCSMCEMEFGYRKSLIAHEQVHSHKQKRFFCPLCQKEYVSNVTLKNHIQTHTLEQNFPCALCHKIFNSRSGLIYHVHKHTKEKFVKTSTLSMS